MMDNRRVMHRVRRIGFMPSTEPVCAFLVATGGEYCRGGTKPADFVYLSVRRRPCIDQFGLGQDSDRVVLSLAGQEARHRTDRCGRAKYAALSTSHTVSFRTPLLPLIS